MLMLSPHALTFDFAPVNECRLQFFSENEFSGRQHLFAFPLPAAEIREGTKQLDAGEFVQTLFSKVQKQQYCGVKVSGASDSKRYRRNLSDAIFHKVTFAVAAEGFIRVSGIVSGDEENVVKEQDECLDFLCPTRVHTWMDVNLGLMLNNGDIIGGENIISFSVTSAKADDRCRGRVRFFNSNFGREVNQPKVYDRLMASKKGASIKCGIGLGMQMPKMPAISLEDVEFDFYSRTNDHDDIERIEMSFSGEMR